MQNQPTPNAQANARALRRGMTDSERRLWSRLRMEQLGVKFRRQHPLGNYIADFACLSPKLIIELDGSQHADQLDYDAARDEFFRNQGFVVLRFASNEPFVNLEGVVTFVAAALVAGGVPPSQPSPERGRSDTPPPSQPSPEGGRSIQPKT
jgi:very-short-patch-repair endonuclease